MKRRKFLKVLGVAAIVGVPARESTDFTVTATEPTLVTDPAEIAKWTYQGLKQRGQDEKDKRAKAKARDK